MGKIIENLAFGGMVTQEELEKAASLQEAAWLMLKEAADSISDIERRLGSGAMQQSGKLRFDRAVRAIRRSC